MNTTTINASGLITELEAHMGELARWESSRRMFVSRLEDTWYSGSLTVQEILALLNDCDYLASLEYPSKTELVVTYE